VQALANYRNHDIYPPSVSGFSPPDKEIEGAGTRDVFSSADTTGDLPPLLPMHWEHHTTRTKLGEDFR
jgi:hypothetical protein